MLSFRLYHFSGDHVVRSEIVEAADEAGAIDEAIARWNGGRTELWAESRLLLAYAGSSPGSD